MKIAWKIIWDILAVAVGVYPAFKVFNYCGNKIPFFGYFPIGVFAGLFIIVIGAYFVHAMELAICWLLFKLFKIQTQETGF
jgi:hypothetical protein